MFDTLSVGHRALKKLCITLHVCNEADTWHCDIQGETFWLRNYDQLSTTIQSLFEAYYRDSLLHAAID